MRPAICQLCGKPAIAELSPNQGDWVEFADYQRLEHFPLGHPVGLEYFCDQHLAAAKVLASSTAEAAIKELKEQYGNLPPYKMTIPTPSLWHRLFFGRKKG